MHSFSSTERSKQNAENNKNNNNITTRQIALLSVHYHVPHALIFIICIVLRTRTSSLFWPHVARARLCKTFRH